MMKWTGDLQLELIRVCSNEYSSVCRPFPICSMYGIFTYIIREPLAHQKKCVP